MDNVTIVSIMANGIAASSALLMSTGRPHIGSPVACIASLVFTAYAWVSRQPEFYFSNAIFFSIHARGTYNWTLKKRYKVSKMEAK